MDPIRRGLGKAHLLWNRWTIFGVMALTYFLVYFHRVSPAVLATDLQGSFGVGLTAVALLSSAYFYAYMVMQLPCGVLTDRWGPRRTVCAFTALSALGALVTALASSFEMVVAGRVMIGLGVAMVYVPTLKVLSSWFRKDEFSTMTGVLLMIGNAGGLAAAGPLAAMSDQVGWRQVFLVLAVLTAVLTWSMWLLVRDRPQDVGLPAVERTEEEDRIPMGSALRQVFSSGIRFWPFAIIFFFMYGSLMVYQGLMGGPYFRDVLGWDKAEYGFSLTFVGLGMIAGCPVSGYLSDRVLRSRRKVVVAGTLAFAMMWGILWLMSGRVNDQMAYTIVHFLFGFFAGWYVPIYGQVKDAFPRSMSGTSLAALNIFPFAGGAVLQMIAGFMMSESSLTEYRAVWLLMLFGMIVAAIAALISKERPS
ncbi:MAG TPA: MFS transporter [Methanomassiliicoccales archaeon]|nr:MFS transporter [Methanomassiliicoccales archaeon]HPR98588.1 MFS transporter [Methanomassiliicoccales archaeon]